ncbi:MAG: pseudouridine synthase [Hyphomonadaceae bacterium]|nr:pseudouridine synthase [Hyphomonadaceae bacterium]
MAKPPRTPRTTRTPGLPGPSRPPGRFAGKAPGKPASRAGKGSPLRRAPKPIIPAGLETDSQTAPAFTGQGRSSGPQSLAVNRRFAAERRAAEAPEGGKPAAPERKQRARPKSVVPRNHRVTPAPEFKPQPPAPVASGIRSTRGDQTPERIAKVLARAGIASRREAEAIIAEGRVAVNGSVLTTPAFTVTPADMITVDGAPLSAPEMTRLWLFHKPDGLVTTHKDPQGRPTVFDSLPAEMPRVISVGRLDLTSEGLLLLTNDGALARTLELPKTGLERTYRARAFGRVTQAALDRLAEGITVEGVEYGPIVANLEKSDASNVWIEVRLTEGRNREVRKVLAALDLTVNRLIRTQYGPFKLAGLPPGGLEELPMKDLRKALGPLMPAQTAGAVVPKPVVAPVDLEALPKKKARKLTGGRGGPRHMMDVLEEEDLIARERSGSRAGDKARGGRAPKSPSRAHQARSDRRGKAAGPLRGPSGRSGQKRGDSRAKTSTTPPKTRR